MDEQLMLQMLKAQKSKKEPLLLGKIDESTITIKQKEELELEKIEQSSWILWRLAAISILEVAIIEKIGFGKLEDLKNATDVGSGNLVWALGSNQNTLTNRIRNEESEELGAVNGEIIKERIIEAVLVMARQIPIIKLKKPCLRVLGSYLASLNPRDK